jgi:hypothetical protein
MDLDPIECAMKNLTSLSRTQDDFSLGRIFFWFSHQEETGTPSQNTQEIKRELRPKDYG